MKGAVYGITLRMYGQSEQQSELPTLTPHHSAQAYARQAALAADIGDKVRALRVLFLRRRGFLRHYDSVAEFGQCDDIGVGFLVLGLGITQAREPTLYRLCLNKNIDQRNE